MISKAKFLVKINNLKKSGKMIKLMRASSEYIDDNIDTIYQNYTKSKSYKLNAESKRKIMKTLTVRSKMMKSTKQISKKEFSVIYEKQ